MNDTKKGWIDWRVVLIVLVILLLLPVLAFLVQRIVTPGVAQAQVTGSMQPASTTCCITGYLAPYPNPYDYNINLTWTGTSWDYTYVPRDSGPLDYPDPDDWALKPDKLALLATSASYGHCYRGSSSAKITGSVFGLKVGTLFTATMTEDYCINGKGQITTYSSGPAVRGEVAGLGEGLNWDYRGVIGGSGPKLGCTNGVCTGLTTKRVVRFHQCTPIPTGCILGRDYDIRLILREFGGGGRPYVWSGWVHV